MHANSYSRINIHIREHEATMEFADNSVGIAHEHVSKIFDISYRAHTDAKGPGLFPFETLKCLKGFVSIESDLEMVSFFYSNTKSSFCLSFPTGTLVR